MRFAVLGDMHYCYSDDSGACERRERLFGKMFERVKADDIDGVLSVGDIVHHGRAEEYDGLSSLMASARLPLTFAFGNHDLILSPAAEVARRFGRRPYLFTDRDRLRIIVLNTSLDVSPRNWGGTIDDDQLRWLREEALSGLGERVPVVIAHHPLPSTTTDSGGKMMSVENGADVWKALSSVRDRPGIYLCGHTHVHSVAVRDNWRFVQTASPVQTLTYRLLQVHGDSVEVRTVAIQDPSLASLAQEVDRAIPSMHRPPHAAGAAPDRASLRLP